MSTVIIEGALCPTHLFLRKPEGWFVRTPDSPDRPMEGALDDPELMRAALLTKWGAYRVLDEQSRDQPEIDANHLVIVQPRTLPDGEAVFQIVERWAPNWDHPEPWQERPRSMGIPLSDRLRVIQGDITQLDVDAIVNAANESLLGGGGVDGAIHRAAGPELLAECRQLGGCPTGAARLTRGYRLPARYVIHTVGPVYQTGFQGEADLLRSCYLESMRVAVQQMLSTVAFPCISTGAFGYPQKAASKIAVQTVINWLRENEHPRQVTFCCFERKDADCYRKVIQETLEACGHDRWLSSCPTVQRERPFAEECSGMSTAPLPMNHDARMERARLALDGLSIGDAFGASIFDPPQPESLRRPRPLPHSPWRYTDDTVMAMGIVEVLQRRGRIDQDELVAAFARRYEAEPARGYGPNTMDILRAVRAGAPWRVAAVAPVSGQVPPGWLGRLASWLSGGPAVAADQTPGSRGNGGAMRVAPVGGYFAEDIAAVVAEARASAEVTHAHPDGMAGAIAVAVAAAWAWSCHAGQQRHTPEGLLDHVLEHTPEGLTRAGLIRARMLPMDTTAEQAARQLGNGSPITSVETVPFTLWCAARHLDDFVEAMWTTVSVGGDIDTNCAIVGGVVALGSGRESIPAEWLEAREALSV